MEERRTARRYPLRLSLEYETHSGHRGAGVIVDITARSARMELDRSYPILTEMCLHVAWPVKLNRSITLRLRINTRVIRTDQRYTVVEFRGYEFVTAGRRQTIADTVVHSPLAPQQKPVWT